MGLCDSGMRGAARPTVSVIIPTHNRADMLGRAIVSVLAQTFTDLELIVVSDGSSDHTVGVVASFADPRLRFLRHETPRGASAARNTGLRAAQGRFFAFLDDDDEWLPHKLAVQVPVLKGAGPKVGLVYCWIAYVQDGAVVRNLCPTVSGDVFRQMLDGNAITNSSALLIRKDVLPVVGGFDERLPRDNDGDFIRRLCKHFQVDCVPEVLVRVYIGHLDRLSIDTVPQLKGAALNYELRLQMFSRELEDYPEQKMNILTSLATAYLQTGQWRCGLLALGRLLACHTGLRHRCLNLARVVKRAAVYNWRRLLVERSLNANWSGVQ